MADREPVRQLLTQAVTGDRAAIQQLLLEYHDQISSVISGKVPADLHAVISADDICQDAYATIFQQITSFEPHNEQAFRRWLMTIAERKLVDAIRAQRAAKRGGRHRVDNASTDSDVASAVELLDLVAVHEHTPSRSAAHHELVGQVHNALLALKDDYRDALQLHYLRCLPVAETAKRMGRSEGAVLMLCNRGLRQLAEIVGDPANFFSRKE